MTHSCISRARVGETPVNSQKQITWLHRAGRVAPMIALCTAGAVHAQDGSFVLSADQLDRVTAGGISIVSDGFSASSALGDAALSESITDASVDPENGNATAFGLAAGIDGSQAVADTGAIGETAGGLAYTDGTADGVSYGAEPTIVTSTSVMHLGGTDTQVGSSAAGSAPETFTTGTAGIYSATDGTQIGTVAEGTGLDLDGNGSTTTAGASLRTPGSSIYVMSGADSDGSLFAVTGSETATGGTTAGIGVETHSFADTGAAGSGSSGTTTVILTDGEGLIVRSTGVATQSGEPLIAPSTGSSISLSDVPSGATVTRIDRSTDRGGISRSITLRMLTR